MENYIKCRHEKGFFIFDTIERYPENIANDILDEFIKQDLEAISYKIADFPSFQVTGRIREQYVKTLPNLDDSDSAKMDTIKKILDYRIQELILDNFD